LIFFRTVVIDEVFINENIAPIKNKATDIFKNSNLSVGDFERGNIRVGDTLGMVQGWVKEDTKGRKIAVRAGIEASQFVRSEVHLFGLKTSTFVAEQTFQLYDVRTGGNEARAYKALKSGLLLKYELKPLADRKVEVKIIRTPTKIGNVEKGLAEGDETTTFDLR